jgi:hypothetical protein
MSGVSLPVTRPAGRALLIGSVTCRTEPLDRLSRQGFHCNEAEDPYAAMVELSRRSSAYQCIVVSLQSLYREELTMIAAVKKRWPHLDIWLTQTDGRGSALAEAMRRGADGLLPEDGLLRTATAAPPPVALFRPTEEPAGPQESEPPPSSENYLDDTTGEPVLTAEELRALLQEPPVPSQRRND